MFTVVETTVFQKIWPHYWHEDERGEFASFISHSPSAGDVVPGSGGIRKVRWKRPGTGKSSGVRVIYYVLNAKEEIVLLTLYAKATTENLSAAQLKGIRDALEK
jgi:mRNA-degrading endonuclease RelE of RelBE toxin-antitoxin system